MLELLERAKEFSGYAYPLGGVMPRNEWQATVVMPGTDIGPNGTLVDSTIDIVVGHIDIGPGSDGLAMKLAQDIVHPLGGGFWVQRVFCPAAIPAEF